MAHTRRAVSARTSTVGNPYQVNVTIQELDTVLVLLIKTVGATDRAGGTPRLLKAPSGSQIGVYTFTQAGTTQKAAASPEAGAEIWYLLNPPTGTSWTIDVPNTNAATLFVTVEAGQAQAGMTSAFDGTNGSNATSANPTCNAIVTTGDGDIGWAITAGGWTTWAPSAQTGTIIANTDDGANGGGEQYTIQASAGSFTFSWTFGTSDDWGAVAVFFKEVADAEKVPENFKFVSAGDGISCSERIR